MTEPKLKVLRCPVCKGRVGMNKGAKWIICLNKDCERYCVYAW